MATGLNPRIKTLMERFALSNSLMSVWASFETAQTVS